MYFWLGFLTLLQIAVLVLLGILLSHRAEASSKEIVTSALYEPPYFLVVGNTLIKPNFVYYEPILFDKAQRLLELGYKAQCVQSVKKLLNITKPFGKITDLKPLKKNAEIGDIGITSPTHVVTVLRVNRDSVTVFDCNYDWKESCRIVEINNSKFLGFFKI